MRPRTPASAVSAEPTVSTIRSPTRSSTCPREISVTTMPQLGIDDSRLASVSGVPRIACREGIRNATPLMKRNELAVTPSEMTRIDHMRMSGPVSVGSVGIRPCSHRVNW